MSEQANRHAALLTREYTHLLVILIVNPLKLSDNITFSIKHFFRGVLAKTYAAQNVPSISLARASCHDLCLPISHGR